jgi:hypothetical protein
MIVERRGCSQLLVSAGWSLDHDVSDRRRAAQEVGRRCGDWVGDQRNRAGRTW